MLSLIHILIYDIFRTMRRVSKASVLGINAEDMLFLIFAGALMFYIAYTQNNGRLRWHGFLGTVCGFLAFRIIFRDRIVKCMTFVSVSYTHLFLCICFKPYCKGTAASDNILVVLACDIDVDRACVENDCCLCKEKDRAKAVAADNRKYEKYKPSGKKTEIRFK